MTTVLLALVLAVSFSFGSTWSLTTPATPEQIHLALTDKSDEMSITWITPNDVSNAAVAFGLDSKNLNQKTLASPTNQHYYFLPTYKSGAIHYAVITGLQPGKQYFYQVGSDNATWSDIFTFSTNRDYPLNILVTGDMGDVAESHQVVQSMLKMNQANSYNFLIHSGDLSYANGYQPIWDSWANMVQPLAVQVPYMASVGNHETFSLWIAFLYRFNMPAVESGADEGNLFYSFDYGPIHVIALSSEMPFFYHWLEQYRWLEKDLASIDRTKTPWVFTTWHRPFYCSNTVHWESDESMRLSYEELLYKYRIDISFTGHIHAYERTAPMYNFSVVDDGFVTLVVGNGGNGEGLYDSWRDPQPVWSLHREATYGYGSLTVYNETTLHWQMIRAQDGKVADDWWFVRNRKF